MYFSGVGVYKKTKFELINDLFYDILFSLVNFFRLSKFYSERFLLNKHRQLIKNFDLKQTQSTEQCFVLGNGPSLNNQDIEKLKNEVVFMVNRSFMDERYKKIKPQYHVIVDNKLATGIWPLSYLDDVYNQNPEVTFILNSCWFDLPEFQDYKEKYKIHWIDQSLQLTNFNLNKKIDLTKRTYGKNVVEQAVVVASYMGYKRIYMTGVDGDGFANILLKQDSHSYGSNSDDLQRFEHWGGVRESICSVCNWMLTWSYLDKYIKNNGSKIVNLSGRGIITMVEMDSFEKVVEKLDD